MRYLTAGESHGKGMVSIIDGVPSNLEINTDKINAELFRRQQGYGRGKRMSLESDTIEFLAGVRGGKTTGAPIAFIINNNDHKNWDNIIGADAQNLDERTVTKLRPGHADFSGCIKYNQSDARNILERASARETAARVAVGAICKQFLEKLDIFIGSHVLSIAGAMSNYKAKNAHELITTADKSVVRCMDKTAEKEMIKNIDFCIASGDTAGGLIEVVASGMPVGVGSHNQFDRKLDYIISGHIASIQAVKSVEIGMGIECASNYGSKVHDEMRIENGKLIRETNNAGGIEGGVSNGENIVVKATIKPIPTLMKGLKTFDLKSHENCTADTERSDYCAVPAASVVCENVLAFCLSSALLDTLGGDHMGEVIERINRKREAALKW